MVDLRAANGRLVSPDGLDIRLSIACVSIRSAPSTVLLLGCLVCLCPGLDGGMLPFVR